MTDMSTHTISDTRQRFAPTRGERCRRTALAALSLPAWSCGWCRWSASRA